jgi:ribosomal-protein-serine acetyltransferase
VADDGRTRSQQALTIPLSGARSLRLLREADTDELYELIANNRCHLARWLPWADAQTRDGTLAFIQVAREQARRGEGFQAAIVEEGRIIGVIGFHGIDAHHRSTTIGYWLHADAQGRGTMTEALRAMVHHALAVWKLNRVEVRATVENTRSRAVIERVGFRFEGIARQAFRLADGYHDDAVYSLLRNEWAQLAPGDQP